MDNPYKGKQMNKHWRTEAGSLATIFFRRAVSSRPPPLACLILITLGLGSTPLHAFVLGPPSEDPLFGFYEEGYGSCGMNDSSILGDSSVNLLGDNGLETIEGLPPKVATGEGNNAVSFATVRRFYDTVNSTMDYLRLFEKTQPSWGNAALSHQVVSSFYDQITNTSDYFRLFPSQAISGTGFVQPNQNLPVMPSSAGMPLWSTPSLGPLPISFSVRTAQLGGIFAGNPINAASGAKVHSEVDYIGGGRFPIVLERMYSSRLTDVRLADVGAGWATSYSDFVAVNKTDLQSALVFRQGRFFKFREANGIWTPERGVFTSLRKTFNAEGQFTGWEYRTEQDTVENFDINGKLVAIRSPAGLTQTLSRDSSGRLVSIIDPAGRTASFSYTPSGQVQSVGVPGAGSISYQYDSFDNLIAVTKLDGTSRRYLYEDQYYPRALTGIVDESGSRYATFTYDMNGRAVSSEHAGGVDKTTLAYNGDGTTTIRTPAGATVTRSFQKINGVAKNVAVTISCPDCGTLTESYSYNEDGLLTSETDPMGHTTSYMYDVRGLLVSKTIAVGTPLAKTLTVKWHPDFRVPTEISTGTKTFVAKYDSKRNLIEKSVVSAGMVRKIAFSYSADGLLTAMDGPRTDVMDIFQFSYDAQGNVASIANPLGHRITIASYTPQGWPKTFVNPNGLIVTLEYDALGRVVKSQAGGNSIDFVYGPPGLLTEIRLPDGSRQKYAYDAAHRLVREVDTQGNYMQYTKDVASRTLQIDIFDALGSLVQTRSQTFNSLNQVVQSRGFNEGPTKFTYDKSGAIVQTENPAGSVRRVTYDDLNRLTEAVDPMNGITRFSYDFEDRLVSVTDPRGLVTSYSYDSLDNITGILSPDSGQTITQYDSAGNIVSNTDARNRQITYLYDALNRPTKTMMQGTTALAYEYDIGPNALGELTKSSYGSGFVERQYDIFGRPTKIIQHSPGYIHKLQYEFDTIGRLAKLTYPSGNVLTYGYSNDGLAYLNINGTPLVSNIMYHPFGGIKSWLWGNGAASVRAFDLDGRLQSYQLGANTKSVEYDAASRIVAVRDPGTPSSGDQFSYDSLDRLIGYNSNTSVQSFTYDANNNRIHAQLDSSSNTYTYPQASNRLQKVIGTETSQFSYDARGNATYAGTKEMEYDSFGRMTEVEGLSGEIENAFNAFHQRVAKSGREQKANFVHDSAGQLIGEYSSSATGEGSSSSTDEHTDEHTYGALQSREHIYFRGVPIAVLAGGTASYVHTDYLGTPRVITDAGSQPIWSWYSDPFGTSLPDEDPDRNGVKFNYNLRFAGQYYDKETGLHQNYFRNYDPGIGRYVESDPIGLTGGINVYAYAEANPIQLLDPFGLAAESTRPGGPSIWDLLRTNKPVVRLQCESTQPTCDMHRLLPSAGAGRTGDRKSMPAQLYAHAVP